MYTHYYYHGSFLKGWNKRMLQSDDPNSGLFDDVAYDALELIVDDPIPETRDYRSRYSYPALMESVSHFFTTSDKNRFLYKGVATANRTFATIPAQPLRAIFLDDPDIYHLANLHGDKSAGLTNFGHSKGESLVMALGYAKQILNGKRPHACITGYRTQNTKIVDQDGHLLPKTRLVWMYPEEMTLLEALIARPLIDYFRKADTQMSFGKTDAYRGSGFLRASNSSNWIVATDQSKFDQHVREIDIHAAFQYFRRFFDLDQRVDIEGHTVRDVFNIVEHYFIYTALVFPSEKGPQITYDKNHGVPSGSYFTQMVDSYVNYALTIQLFSDLHVKFSPANIFVLGDDMVAFTYGKTTVEDMHAQAAQYGYNIHNDEKSEVLSTEAPSFDYIGVHWVDCVPVRYADELISHVLYPESWRDYRHVKDKLRASLELIYSYGLTAIIRGMRWSRGSLIHVSLNQLAGLPRFMAQEYNVWNDAKGIVPSVY